MFYIRLKTFIINKIGNLFRKKFKNSKERNSLKNKNFTILSQHCIGGIISHDLGLKFLSPTVNLYMSANDFVKFVENLDYYLSCDIEEVKTNSMKYPVGLLDDLSIHFIHYKTIEESRVKWNDRKKRINRDNMFIIMSERDSCTEELVERFDKLPYKNKIIFTCKKYNYKSCIYIEKFKNEKEVGIVTNMNDIFGNRIYQLYFDYIHWLNTGEIIQGNE